MRAKRGWMYTPGVDDVESECALDGKTMDFVIDNDGDDAAVQDALHKLIDLMMVHCRTVSGTPLIRRIRPSSALPHTAPQ